jgi:cytoskeletal protein CcmA (bactofilin family)
LLQQTGESSPSRKRRGSANHRQHFQGESEMFRPGRNPKDTTQADETADHTPSHASGQSHAGNPSYAGGTSGLTNGPANATEAYQQGLHTPTASRAVTESESLARDIKEGTLTGFVGNGTVLTGEASFKGMLRVDGRLSGRVSSEDGTLIISTNGQVDANIEVAVAQIYGTVNGDIIASKRIEMGRVARVTGNIQTPALVIENGAIFEGSCRMVQLKESLEKKERKETGKGPTPGATARESAAPEAAAAAPVTDATSKAAS